MENNETNQTLTPFDWLDSVINSIEGITKTSASIDDIRATMVNRNISDEQIKQVVADLEKPLLSGKHSKFSKMLDIKPPATYDWRKRGIIPQGRLDAIIEIAASNGLTVTKHNLRPDLWDENNNSIKGLEK